MSVSTRIHANKKNEDIVVSMTGCLPYRKGKGNVYFEATSSRGVVLELISNELGSQRTKSTSLCRAIPSIKGHWTLLPASI
jgi:hypothetical protein